MNELQIDPEFRSLIPPLTKEEYEELEGSIKEEGCRDAIVIWDKGNVILDGHNRYEICSRHNIPFKTLTYDFKTRDQVKEWMIKNQFGRRNLPTEIRLQLAMKYKPYLLKKAQESKSEIITKQNLGQASKDAPPKVSNPTRKKLADIAGVSEASVMRYEAVMSKGDEELKEKVNKGEITVSKAYEQVRQPKAEPKKEVSKICKDCGECKPITEFEPYKNSCRKCNNEKANLRRYGGTTKSIQKHIEDFKNVKYEDIEETLDLPVLEGELNNLIFNLDVLIGSRYYEQDSDRSIELIDMAVERLNKIRTIIGG